MYKHGFYTFVVLFLVVSLKVKVKFICIAHFMYRTIQSALHKIKALQQRAEKALKYVKEYKWKEIK